MLQGLDYMLMAPLDDEARSMLLFPTFPTGQWDVRFKMHAPLNTTVEASCQGALPRLQQFLQTVLLLKLVNPEVSNRGSCRRAV